MKKGKNKNQVGKSSISLLLKLLITIPSAVLALLILWIVALKILMPKSIADVLPAEKTLAFIEIDFEVDESKTKKFIEDVKKIEKVNIFIQEFILSFSRYKEIIEVIGKKFGIGVLEFEGKAQVVLMVNYVDKAKMIEAVKGIAGKGKNGLDNFLIEKIDGFEVASFLGGERWQVVFIDGKAIFADKFEVVKLLIDTAKGRQLSLRQVQKFNEIRGALPKPSLGFVYVDFEKIVEFLNKDFNFVNGYGKSWILAAQFGDVFEKAGFSLGMQENGVLIREILRFSSEKIDLEEIEKNKVTLLKFLDVKPEYFLFVENPYKNLILMEKIAGKKRFGAAGIVGSVVEMLNDILGSKISSEDLGSLFEGEVLIIKIGDSWVLGAENFAQTDLNLRKVFENFAEKIAREKVKKIEEIVVPDGSKGEIEVLGEVLRWVKQGDGFELVYFGTDGKSKSGVIFLQQDGKGVVFLSDNVEFLEMISKKVGSVKLIHDNELLEKFGIDKDFSDEIGSFKIGMFQVSFKKKMISLGVLGEWFIEIKN